MAYRKYEMIENPMVSRRGSAGLFMREGDASRDRDMYVRTENRLYSHPFLRAHIDELKDEFEELSVLGVDALKESSRSLVQLIRPGMRLEPEEVHEAQLRNLRVKIAANEREHKRVELALQTVRDDPYYLAIELKYFQNQKEPAIAERLCCDPATVRRNIKRLVNAMTVRLCGFEAL